MAANSSTDDVTVLGAASVPATGLQGSGNVGSVAVAGVANTASHRSKRNSSLPLLQSSPVSSGLRVQAQA